MHTVALFNHLGYFCTQICTIASQSLLHSLYWNDEKLTPVGKIGKRADTSGYAEVLGQPNDEDMIIGLVRMKGDGKQLRRDNR